MLRLLALGDSYTIGEGVEPAGRWPSRVAVRLRESGMQVADPEIIAVTGWTTDELAAGIDGAAPTGPFDAVTLLIGVNDQYRGHGVAAYAPRFEALLERAVELAGGRSARVVVVSIPDWGVAPFAAGRDRRAIGAEIDAFNAAACAATARRGAAWVDVTVASRAAGDAADAYAADGLHPSARAYAEWAELVLPAVQAALGERSVGAVP
jgi:lysophospholipase L1-like esterase